MRRTILQHKIQTGEIQSFEGKVDFNHLKEKCPTVKILEQTPVLEKMQFIKDNAYANRVRTAHLPDAKILFSKLNRAQLETKLERKKSLHYLSIVSELRDKLQDTEIKLQGKQKEVVNQLLSLIATKLYEAKVYKAQRNH